MNMKKLLLTVVLAGGLQAAPVILPNGVVNAASSRLVGMPGSGIARGGLFSAYGSGMGPVVGVSASAFPLQTTLGGVSIRITLGTTTLQAIPLFVSAGQVNGIMPSNAPLGRVAMTITYQNETSPAVMVEVVAVSYGIITYSSGIGQAVIQNVARDGALTLNTLSNSARRQQLMQGYGTGMGAINAPDNQPPPAGDLNTVTDILVGGRQTGSVYAGRSPCCAGLDQLNFEIPADAPLGCFVPLVVRAGEFWSNVATIAISADGGPCRDEVGPFSPILTGGGTKSIGTITLFRTSLRGSLLGFTFDSTSDDGQANFFRTDESFYHANFALPPAGACSISVARASSDPTMIPTIPLPNLLDAGNPLRVTGPNGDRTLPRQAAGSYSATLGGGATFPGGPAPPPLYLTSGRHTVTGPGGANVGAFTAAANITDPINWTNRDQIQMVNRSQALTVNWTGGVSSREIVQITGFSTDSTMSVIASFLCIAPAGAGSFTIPVWVLASMPPTATISGVPVGALLLGGSTFNNPVNFTASGLDLGVLYYGSLSGKILAYQ